MCPSCKNLVNKGVCSACFLARNNIGRRKILFGPVIVTNQSMPQTFVFEISTQMLECVCSGKYVIRICERLLPSLTINMTPTPYSSAELNQNRLLLNKGEAIITTMVLPINNLQLSTSIPSLFYVEYLEKLPKPTKIFQLSQFLKLCYDHLTCYNMPYLSILIGSGIPYQYNKMPIRGNACGHIEVM